MLVTPGGNRRIPPATRRLVHKCLAVTTSCWWSSNVILFRWLGMPVADGQSHVLLAGAQWYSHELCANSAGFNWESLNHFAVCFSCAFGHASTGWCLSQPLRKNETDQFENCLHLMMSKKIQDCSPQMISVSWDGWGLPFNYA